MMSMTIPVELGERRYPVYLGSGTLGDLGRLCRTHAIPETVVVLADRNSARAALTRAKSSLAAEGYRVFPLVMPPGEHQKNPTRARTLHTAMLRESIPRKAAMIALGGGVVGDVAGYVASTYRRGILFVQVPTTLLSQVDSSVGGKNGVNFPQGKNSVGTFHQPQFVLSDVDLLPTLPRREVIAGLGEILKYPLIADPPLLGFLEEHLDGLLAVERDIVLEIASRCLRIKAALVSEDERELRSDRGRVLLNVGHAIGHALETLSDYKLRHGEAVLLGILAEGYIAVRKTGFPEHELDRLVGIYRRLRKQFDYGRISMSSIQRFALGKGGARFVLPRTPGEVVVLHDVTADDVEAGIRFLKSL